jgi:2-aminoethylphosphonate transport system permease protein
MTMFAGPGAAALVLGTFGLALTLLVLLPMTLVILSAFAARWTMTILPATYTLRWFELLRLRQLDPIVASLTIAAGVGAASAFFGTYAAYVVTRKRPAGAAALDALLMLPVALPTVVIGLALLVAFHRPPVMLTGSPLIVALAHFVIVFPFTYRSVAGVLEGLDPRYEEVAASLGAGEATIVARVVVPLVAPGILSGFILSFALSMGELGATSMVYPPSYSTMPVAIFELVERGFYAQGAAMSVILLGVGFAALVSLYALQGRLRRFVDM